MNIKELIKENIFYRQHPEAALRYLPIVDLIKELKLERSKILEVGSGSYGITPYLKQKVVGVDTLFDEPEYSLLEQVEGSASNLPFKDNSFDLVIFSDVLEHIPEIHRKKCLEEAIRVAKKYIIIGGPFGQQSFEQDKLLAKFSKLKIGKMHKFFREHLKYGLPEIGDIRSYIKESTKVSEIKVVGHYLNLKTREKIMKLFILGQSPSKKILYYTYLKGLMPMVSLIRHLNSKPCYRSLILITLKKE